MRFRFSSGPFAAFALIGAVCVAALGCTASQKTQPARKKSAEPYRVEKEGKIPPLSPSDLRKEVDREERYEDLPVSDETLEVEAVEPMSQPPVVSPDSSSAPRPAAPERKTMDGYRIQVFASANEASARSVSEAVEARVGVPVYVELIDGIYKVRVGDCPSRAEAEVLLKTCRDAGYGDAWVSSGRIFMPSKKTGE